MDATYVRRLQFKNYKGLGEYSIDFDQINIMVGPNNCGKSTVIGAFRLLELVIRRARYRKPETFRYKGKVVSAYKLDIESSPISLENVRTNYSDDDASIDFYFSNQSRLEVNFSTDNGCVILPHPAKRKVTSPATFKTLFPISVYPVPVLGPLEHNEPIVQESTIRSALSTHRASRHFRNYWNHYPDGFDKFAELISRTWPGMTIHRPEKPELLAKHLVMFCRENNIDRELYWAGFGFQIWCQLLSHLSRAANDSIVVIDEPEIYLHPEVQRQLLNVIRKLGPQVLLATHSVEIMGEADPSDIIAIDKMKIRSERLKSLESFQETVESIGSIHNVTLAQIARNRRVCFVEGEKDFIIIRRFAAIMGYSELANGIGLNAVMSGGFSSWERVEGLGWGLTKALDTDLRLAAIFDRDYYCEEQINEIEQQLLKHIEIVHFHQRKEIENYLLIPTALQRAANVELANRSKRRDEPIRDFKISAALEELTEPLKKQCQASYIGARTKYYRNSGKDDATIAIEAIETFEDQWGDMELRMQIVPGKTVLKALRTKLQAEVSINLTDIRILNSIHTTEVPGDILNLLDALNKYRALPYSRI